MTQNPIPVEDLLADLPAVRPVDPAEVAARREGGGCLVVLDDDPTGTQTVADVPVLTTWGVDDLRWALTPGGTCFVLTNTRSLSAADADARNREVLDALARAADAEQVDFVVASRSDSTLRGHFPRETDVIARELAERGRPVDGVVIVPAFPSAGRFTIDAVHWARTPEGVLPAGRTEFARDATFGYRSSDLREWVEEKSGGAVAAEDVLAVTLTDLRVGGPERVAELLSDVRGGRAVVVDAACDDDLRVLALALLEVESRGTRLLYRVGPAFVRSRAGQAGAPPLSRNALRAMGAADGHGLIAVGSHVGLTTSQLDGLRELGGVTELELDVTKLLDACTRDDHVAEVADAAARSLEGADVVVRTSRTLVTGDAPDASLAIARAVSAGLVDTVRAAVEARRPAFVVAKGGITSSDIATDGLDVRRAVVRGTMLPGIISLWQAVSGEFAGLPYVVFPGNVGDRSALADVVAALRTTC
ncbi:hypothetical protein EIL87_20015 [Saccharopolyspora rhizosphaerae]|uniref:Four-carbon acid sugar kinase family protein n=1 Tax=Saccharopolyspora rhizosphaerae TaxID=2492662 RepID=A0A426JMQ1_9PSEU|nr:four-carbon acid sugar kinase family protein [Saccharopolyspora rhizosphaerae]RRO14468.1 hypothetical protein EIL87_20015 [Saccharopolyspora rhizosphaerae]